MYRQNNVLVELLEPVITALGYCLWGIEQSSAGRGTLVRIYIDSASGINLSDCERVSKQVVGVLDVEDPIQGAYNLEVSSPGLDRPLFTPAQFEQFAGEQVQVRLRGKIDGRRKITGLIEAVDNGTIVVIEDGVTHQIPADAIEQAHIVPQI